MPQLRQAGGVNQVITVAQQPDNRPAPNFFHGVLFKEDVLPDVVFNIGPAAGDGQVNGWGLVEPATAGVQGALRALPAGPPEHGLGKINVINLCKMFIYAA